MNTLNSRALINQKECESDWRETDVNAARNIRDIFIHLNSNNGERPEAFRRQNTRPEIAPTDLTGSEESSSDDDDLADRQDLQFDDRVDGTALRGLGTQPGQAD